MVYDACAPKLRGDVLEVTRWESFVWPRWLPERARLPLVAQLTGAVALTALVVGPWWSRIPESSPNPVSTAVHQSALTPAVTPAPPRTAFDAAAGSARPAHLNLDVRHSFASVDLSVTVDGRPALNNKLDGSGKRFKMFGKRAEKGFTRTLDLAPGVRVVRVRVTSPADKFDQTRVERFDLGAASVAAIRIAADKSGMSLVAHHPSAPPAPNSPAPSIQAAVTAAPAAPLTVPAPAAAATTSPTVLSVATRPPQAESALLELVQSLRSMLIAIAGFVASAATGFVVQEFLRRRRGLLFEEPQGPARSAAGSTERRRRRRVSKAAAPRDNTMPATDRESSL